MELFTLPGAPNPTKVMLYIAEKEQLGADLGITQTVVNVFKGEQRGPEHLKRNPFGTMPVLLTAGGNYLFESRVIIDYLEDMFPTPSLWGDDIEERNLSRNLERVADVRTLSPIGGYVHSVNSPIGVPADPVRAAAFEEQFRSGLSYFDGLLADGRELLAGSRITVADCTLQGALQFMRFRELEDLSDFPNVARWSASYRERPAAQAVLKF